MRGINSQPKWDDIRDKISESACSIVCLQETKREQFDLAYLRNFCNISFNKFAYSPSQGASGGLITIWKGRLFAGILLNTTDHSITVEFTSCISGHQFHVTNIYAPAAPSLKLAFISWLNNFDTSNIQDWILLGDFNLIRTPENRNKPGGNIAEMLMFNYLIHNLDLVDIPFKGRAYTWSNM